MAQTIIVEDFVTVTLGFAVFLMGVQINSRVEFLRRFNIPEPVTGGLLASLVVLALYMFFGIELNFELETRDFLLVLFFTGIGLNTRLSDLVVGGKPLFILVILTVITILFQNAIGAIGAGLADFPLKAGILFGSGSLIGGHGTAIAWAPEVNRVTGLTSAAEVGVAVATLGLVVAALVGGPVAKYLIEKHDLTPDAGDEDYKVGVPVTENAPSVKLDHLSVMRVMMFLNVSIFLGYALKEAIEEIGVILPLFVPCLIMGILIANLRSKLRPSAPQIAGTSSLALISEFALGAFLAMSLMSLQLWTIAELGVTIALIILLQTVVTVAFVIFVLFPLLGRGYFAAVLAAGFAGFSLGATPTAIANMTAVTKKYGPSPIAFIVLPLVSAFFVSIANVIVIQAIMNF